MKRLILLLTALALISFNLTACNTAEGDEIVDLGSSNDAITDTGVSPTEKSSEETDRTDKTDKKEETNEDGKNEENNEDKENGKNEENKPLDALPESSQGLGFTLNDDGKGYTLTNLWDCEDEHIIVGQYKGLPVTAISPDMHIHPFTHSITIGHSVTELHAESFVGMSSFLEGITVQEGNPVYHSSGNCLIETATSKLIVGANQSVIPDGSVKIIGEKAFSQLNILRKIVIPDSVVTIENSAFYDCYALKEVVLSKSLKSIAPSAFGGCTNLEGDLIIPEGVTYVGEYAFADTAFQSVTTPSTLKNIETRTFYSCPLKKLIISPGVVSIGKEAFAQCVNIESIVIPEGVTTIEEGVFDQCSSLKNVSLPNSLIDVAPYVRLFFTCRQLVFNEYKGAYYLGNDSNPYVYLVYGISSSNPYTEIHPETRVLSSSAFLNYVGTDLVIPKKVQGIHNETFHSIRNVTSISVDKDNAAYYSVLNCIIETATGTVIIGREISAIPEDESVTILGERAFLNSQMSSIAIPSNIKEIGDQCFLYCDKLETITYDGTKEEWHSIVKGEDWNESTGNYTVKCTDGDIAKAHDK